MFPRAASTDDHVYNISNTINNISVSETELAALKFFIYLYAMHQLQNSSYYKTVSSHSKRKYIQITSRVIVNELKYTQPSSFGSSVHSTPLCLVEV